VHDILNIFQVTGFTRDDRYFLKPSSAKKGDYFEFFAEVDLLSAISTCTKATSLCRAGEQTKAIRCPLADH